MATGTPHVPRMADPTTVRRGLVRMVRRPRARSEGRSCLADRPTWLHREWWGSAGMSPERCADERCSCTSLIHLRPRIAPVTDWSPRAVLREGRNPGPSMWLLASLLPSLVHLLPTRGRVRNAGIDGSVPHRVSANYSHHVNVTCEDLSVGMKWLEDMEPWHDLGVARRELTARAIIAAVRPPSCSALRGRLRGCLSRG